MKAEELPGKEHAIDYLTHKFRRNLKGPTLASSGTAIRFFLTFLRSSGKDRLEDISRHDIAAFVEHEQDRGLQARGVRTRLVAVYSLVRFLVDQVGTSFIPFSLFTTWRTSAKHHLPFGLVDSQVHFPFFFSFIMRAIIVEWPCAEKSFSRSSAVYLKQ